MIRVSENHKKKGGERMKSMKQIGYGVLAATLLAPAAVLAQFNTGASTASSARISTGTVSGILTTVMNWLLGILGIGAIISFVIAGIIYLTAAGDEGKTEKAKNMMTYAIVAVVVALIGYVVVNTISGLLGGGGQTASQV